MGMEDRDWYREKKIDWERGGLKDRNAKRRRRFPEYAWWIIAAVMLLTLSVLVGKALAEIRHV